jgi:hypothetical protein
MIAPIRNVEKEKRTNKSVGIARWCTLVHAFFGHHRRTAISSCVEF